VRIEGTTTKMLTTEQWLPLGSVVHLAGSDDLVTIFGYMQQDLNTGLVWDYFGLVHPVGFTEPGNDIMFDRDSIDGVMYLGYQDFTWEHMNDLLRKTEPSYLEAKRAAAARASGDGARTTGKRAR
jgi:hypothetical protein